MKTLEVCKRRETSTISHTSQNTWMQEVMVTELGSEFWSLKIQQSSFTSYCSLFLFLPNKVAEECQRHFKMHKEKKKRCIRNLVYSYFKSSLYIPITFPKVCSEAHYSYKMLYHLVSINKFRKHSISILKKKLNKYKQM